MKIQHSLASILAAATSLCIALPSFAAPAVLTGQQAGSRVNVRVNPTTASYAPHYGLVGDAVEVLNQTQGNDGYTWYYIQFPSGAEGWVRGDFVRLVGQETRPAVLVGSVPGSRVNIRSAPTIASASPHFGLVGDRIDVLRTTDGRDGYIWYYVRFPSRAEGWVRGDFVQVY